MPYFYIHLLVWNDRRYLPDLFASIEAQTYKRFSVRILDNGSTDSTLDYIKEHHPTWLVARNVRNLGFAGGHNQLMKFTFEHVTHQSEEAGVVIMNADMILKSDCFEKLAEAFQRNQEVNGFQPKIYRAFGEVVGNEVIDEMSQSDILDSTGLRLQKSWRMVDRGAGELDKNQFDASTDIIAPSGTMALYRFDAIPEMLENDEFFDSTFFAYREDCDFALRFKKRGMKALFVPEAHVWHYRGMFGAEKQSLLSRLKNRRGQRPFFAALSTRNQLFVLLKHLSFSEAILSSPRLLLNECMRVLYGFFFEKETRSRLLYGIKYIPEMWRKRKIMKETRMISRKELWQYAGKR